MSEALREEQGGDEIQREREGDDEADDVRGHRRSVPRTSNPSSTNIPTVSSR
jgi:hypothetical protein